MIREFKLNCSLCQKPFGTDGTLFYRPFYGMSSDLRDVEFICPDCIAAWHDKWKVKTAQFHEQDYVMTVDLELEDGTVYTGMDCTPLDETETVVVGEDIPVEAQQKLYTIYKEWDLERKAHILKDCTFDDGFMNMTFSCETYGGEKFENVAFRFNMKGVLQTAVPIPDYVKEQIVDAYRLYESQMSDDEVPSVSSDDIDKE